MDQHLSIKNFVRNTLGCTCPDKVFEQIENRRTPLSFSPHSRSMIIGGRLLIYIWLVEDKGMLGKNIPAMLAAGRKERDERGLNRFRAVLAVDSVNQYDADAANRFFTEFVHKDDRMHLHIVSKDALAGL